MTKINYYDGKKYRQIEVSDDVATAYEKMSRDEQREHWRMDKRSLVSIDEMSELGEEISDNSDIVQEYIETEEIAELRLAIKKLKPPQQELIKKLFYKDLTQTEVARTLGVDKSAINHKLKTIYNKIKKFLK